MKQLRIDAAAQAAEPDTPDAINLSVLLREADTRVRHASRAGARSLASLPLIYVVGDEDSGKTLTVLQSGLNPELIAGDVYHDGAIVPTQLANLWLANKCVLVEAGGPLLRRPPLWLRLIGATLPERLGSVFSSDDRLAARSVLLCVSVERIMAPNTYEQVRTLAQSLNERLCELSHTLGFPLPVSVLFTKLDKVATFADYMKRLSEDETRRPLGSLLPAVASGPELYPEQATALIGSRFDQLIHALGEFRLETLSRGGELDELARAFDFPREMRKLRAGIVSFLTEVARPCKTGVNPFLRGFFFAGMRTQIIEETLEAVSVQQQPVAPIKIGAPGLISIAPAQAPSPAPHPRSDGTRKVEQWVFLPHLFSKVLLAEKPTFDTGGASARARFLKRALLATSSGIFLLLALTTVSFVKNRTLEKRIADAASVRISPPSAGSLASQRELEALNNLRVSVEKLRGYRKDGPPICDHMGLYRGNALYPIACQAYTKRFTALLLNPAQQNILAKLRALPAAPATDFDYAANHRALKAYLITVSNPNPDSAQDTVDFLPSALSAEWAGNAMHDANLDRLAQAQFAFYASLLAEPSSCMAKAGGLQNDVVVAHARFYFNGFEEFEHAYQRMMAAANRKLPVFDFNSRFPGSSQYILDNYPVQGAFSKDGFKFMQDAILHPDPYLRGEDWVLSRPSGPPTDRAALSAEIRQAYTASYVQTWRNYLTKAQFIPYRDLADAGNKLAVLDSNSSALLELFSLISLHTTVAPEISSAFQAPQLVAPPSGDNRLIGPADQSYIQSLQGLEGAVKKLSLNPGGVNDSTAVAPVTQAVLSAEQAAESMRRGFLPDPTGGIDQTTFNLLEAPIESVKKLTPAGSMNGRPIPKRSFTEGVRNDTISKGRPK